MVGWLEAVVTRQYDVCVNPDRSSRGRIPYFVVLQSDFLELLETVIVAPVLPDGKGKTISRLNPVIIIDGKAYRANMHHLSSMPRNRLGQRVAGGNASSQHAEFVAAIDLLFTGI